MSGRVITVFDSSSQLGRSVARALAQHYRVRAVIDSADASKSHGLNQHDNIEVIQLNLEEPYSLDRALAGAYGCFVITRSDYSSPDSFERELREGRSIVDACRRNKIQHVLYSSQLSVVDILGIQVRHMDAKAKVEAYMRQCGLPLSIIILPFFYENLLTLPFRPKRIQADDFLLAIPMGNIALNMMSVEDVGDVVCAVFASGERFMHKTLTLSADVLTMKELANILTGYLSPKRFVDRQITTDQLRKDGFPGCDDLANMFEFFRRVDQRCNIDLTKNLFPALRSFEKWLTQNANLVTRAVEQMETITPKPMVGL